MWQYWITRIILNERVPLRWIFVVPTLAIAMLFIVHGCMYPFSRAADMVVGAVLLGFAVCIFVVARWWDARHESRRSTS